eukprot:797191-Prorocentrum_lima.AAC.1
MSSATLATSGPVIPGLVFGIECWNQYIPLELGMASNSLMHSDHEVHCYPSIIPIGVHSPD